MPIQPLFGKTYSYLANSLDITQRQQVFLSSNIANMDTPKYLGREIDFKKTLQNAMEGTGAMLTRTHERHLGGATDELTYIMSTRDKGKIDIDVEMSKLAQNNLKHRMASEALIRNFKKMGSILGGR
jgi:flagellar basal-body rod protein FlgB